MCRAQFWGYKDELQCPCLQGSHKYSQGEKCTPNRHNEVCAVT